MPDSHSAQRCLLPCTGEYSAQSGVSSRVQESTLRRVVPATVQERVLCAEWCRLPYGWCPLRRVVPATVRVVHLCAECMPATVRMVHLCAECCPGMQGGYPGVYTDPAPRDAGQPPYYRLLPAPWVHPCCTPVSWSTDEVLRVCGDGAWGSSLPEGVGERHCSAQSLSPLSRRAEKMRRVARD